MDRIVISDLQCRCIIGIDEQERRKKQDVVINLAISTDLRVAGKSDRFEDALDYRALQKQILSLVASSRYHLIEALAEAIARLSLANPQVHEVVVRVDKPQALRFAKSVAVEIARSR